MDKNWNEFCKKCIDKVILHSKLNDIEWSLEIDKDSIILSGTHKIKHTRNDLMLPIGEYNNSNISDEELIDRLFTRISYVL